MEMLNQYTNAFWLAVKIGGGLVTLYFGLRLAVNGLIKDVAELRKDLVAEIEDRKNADADVRESLSEGVKVELKHGTEVMTRIDGEIKDLEKNKRSKAVCDERHRVRRKTDSDEGGVT
jgi:hypothetical protein